MEERLTNKQKRQLRVSNKDRWARRKLGNKAKRKAVKTELVQNITSIPKA